MFMLEANVLFIAEQVCTLFLLFRSYNSVNPRQLEPRYNMYSFYYFEAPSNKSIISIHCSLLRTSDPVFILGPRKNLSTESLLFYSRKKEKNYILIYIL